MIDSTMDGIVYCFVDRGMPATWHHQIEADAQVESYFSDWPNPEVMRIFAPASLTPRELAQDGLFLVKANLNETYGFGQGFKFRIPAELKEDIAKELWRAGYTPRRIVRGQIGLDAHQSLAQALQFNPQ